MAKLFVPHQYQEEVIRRAIEQERLGLLMDPGLGKTATMLETFRRLREWLDVSSVLVVAPLRCCYSVWPPEMAKWTQFEGLRVQVIHGATRQQEFLRGADVYVTNPESLRWLEQQRWSWPEMLVVDESTKFKRASSGRSETLRRMLGHFSRRYILTGTPAPNGLEDLHGQILLLDGGRALGRAVEDFRENWEVQVPTGERGHRKWRLRRGATEDIYKRIAPLVVRLDASDHLDLPELVTVDVPVAMPPETRDLYEQLQNEMVLRLEGGDVVAFNAGALTAKCRQIAGGSVYTTPDPTKPQGWSVSNNSESWVQEVVNLHTAKQDALRDLYEELGGKNLLVSYEFRHQLPLIRAALEPLTGQPLPHIGGDVPARVGERLAAEWSAGKLPALAVHPASAGHGLNLQGGGHHLCFFSIPWDLELYQQLIARLWRQGQSERVMVYRLMAERTVDQIVARALDRKDGDQTDLLDWLKSSLRVR
jgi:SNF2 family DNA or RNA helicase